MSMIPVTPSTALGNRTSWNPTVAIQAFAARKRNTNTKWAYMRDMRDYQGWCEAMGVALEQADTDTVNAYVEHLTLTACHCRGCRQAPGQRGKALAPSTVARRLAAITGFYEYLIDKRVMDRNPAQRVERPKVPNRTQTLGASAEQVSALLHVAAQRGVQELVLVGVMATAGLRISEVLGIQVGDLTEQRGHLVVEVTIKGGDTAVVTIAPELVPAIRALEAERQHDPILRDKQGNELLISRPLFRNARGGHLSRQQASALVSAMARKAGVEGLSAHSLRHAYVTLALDAGMSIRDVAAGAHHKDVRTTMRYDHARQELDRSPTYAVASQVMWP